MSNLGGIHQTAIHLAVIWLDLLGSDAEFNTVSHLREEFKQVTYSDGDPDKWTKQKIANMIKADSLGRETLRLHTFGGRTMFRRVLVDGLRTEDGIEIPKETMFSVMSKMPHTDEDTYEEPFKYDPFRFSRVREQQASILEGNGNGNRNGKHSGSGKTDKGSKPSSPVTFVSTSPDYLAFSLGKHACPGRFILDFEMKMMLCYLLKHYDIEWPEDYAGKRPENVYITEACFPPKGARMRVRRRAVAAF